MGIQRGAQSHSGMGENTMRVLNSGRSDRYIANIYIFCWSEMLYIQCHASVIFNVIYSDFIC